MGGLLDAAALCGERGAAEGGRIAVAEQGAGLEEKLRNGAEHRMMGIDALFRGLPDQQVRLEKHLLTLVGEPACPAQEIKPPSDCGPHLFRIVAVTAD